MDTTGSVTNFPTGEPTEYPVYGIAAGADGNVWFTQPGADSPIARISPDGNVTGFDTGSSDEPTGIAAGPDGNMWFLAAPYVAKITPAGAVTRYDAGLPLYNREAIVRGSDGNMWFTTQATFDSQGAISKMTPDGVITKYPLGANVFFESLAEGPDGNVWFAFGGGSGAIGKITPDGAVTDWPLPAGVVPLRIAPGADGNMWFTFFTQGGGPNLGTTLGTITMSGSISFDTDTGALSLAGLTTGPDGKLWLAGGDSGAGAIVRLDIGAPAAVASPPSLAGTGAAGAAELCAGTAWSSWAGQQPSLSAYGYDGYQWLLDGAPIAGATDQAYTPTNAEAGHTLSCKLTATYTLFPATVTATSSPVTIQPKPTGGGTGGGGGGGAPNLHVTVNAAPVPHNVGDQFTYAITVTNPGGASSGSTLTVNLPSQVGYQGFHVDRGPGCSASGQTVTCNLDFFPPGQVATIQIGAQVNTTGTATLTTSTLSQPQEYDPTNSAITYILTIGAPTPGVLPTQATAPVTSLTTAAILKLTALQLVVLHKKPSLSFKLNASRAATITIRLLGKGGKPLATWHRTAGKGKNVLKLQLPMSARHAGKDRLQLVQAGAKALLYRVTLKP